MYVTKKDLKITVSRGLHIYTTKKDIPLRKIYHNTDLLIRLRKSSNKAQDPDSSVRMIETANSEK